MAAPAFNFNPYIQTTAAGMFTIESDGLIVGTAYPDPAVRFQLAGGLLATSETLPMFGGLAISEAVPQERPPVTRADVALGGIITRATGAPGVAAGSMTGFSVFDQNYAAVNTPQSQVPTVGSGGLVNFYRMGSLARIALSADPALAAAVETGTAPISVAIYWDPTNLRVTTTSASNYAMTGAKILAVKSSNCMVPSYSAATGFTTWSYNGAAAVVMI